MKLQKKMWALGLVLAVAAALIGFFIPSANADTTPPWEPDPQHLGTISFYDSNGTQVTSGSDLTNLFTYAAASTDTNRPGTTKAFLSYAFPDHTKTTAQYFTTAASFATFYPVTSSTAPANIKALTAPVVTTTNTGAANLTGVLGQASFDPTTGYNNILQVRLGDTGGGFTQDSTIYWSADILINKTAGTWTQVYPAVAAPPTATSTTVSASPTSPQKHGTSVTFTATVSPSAAAGSVIFSDGGAAISPAETVSGGHATFTTNALSVNTHSITAAFTPTTPADYGSSTSTALSYVITSNAATTTTSLSVTPTSPITAGTASTLKATIAPAAAGTVQFYDGTTAIDSPVDVTAGQATLTHSFDAGNYSLKATFTPTDPTSFTSSTSTATPYVVNAPATPTTTSLTITPASPQVFGTSLTYSATVAPSAAAGTVNFLDGSNLIGSSPVSAGAATLSKNTLAAGTHSITAQFVPTSPATYETSTSAPTSYTITKADSTVSLAVSPANTAEQNATVSLTATVGPTGVGGGTVQFSYSTGGAPINLGGPVTVVGATATAGSSNLPLTTMSLSAVFTPSSPNYNVSPADTVNYSITKPPPGSTTTGLTVSPSSPVAEGTLETLKATVSPATADGVIQFFDKGSMILAPVTVVDGAATTTDTLDVDTHSLTAMFLPSDTTLFTGSSSTPVSYQVLPPATATTTTLTVGPGDSEPFGSAITLTANVSPDAPGSVTFKDGSTTIGSSAVASGTATLTTTGLHGGSHSITATFVPTSPLLFATSTSDPSTLTITSVATTTSLSINPVGPVSQGASVTLSATLTPANAAGSVTFVSGSSTLGSATVVSGVAKLTTAKLPIGADSITASFAAAHAGDFDASTSQPATISVLTPPVIDTVFANGKLLAPGGTTVPEASLQIHAEGFQPDETVTVDVHSTTIKIGSVKASATGFATVTVVLPASLPLGTHTLSMVGSIGTATFTFKVAKAPTGGGGSGSGGGGGLANTGVNVGIGIGAGLLLLVSGLALLGASRRRGGVRG